MTAASPARCESRHLLPRTALSVVVVAERCAQCAARWRCIAALSAASASRRWRRRRRRRRRGSVELSAGGAAACAAELKPQALACQPEGTRPPTDAMAGLQTPTTAAAVAETSGTFECNICFDQASDPVVTHVPPLLLAARTVDAAERVARLPDLQVRHLQEKMVPIYGRGGPQVDLGAPPDFLRPCPRHPHPTQRWRASAPPADRASCRRPRRSPSDHTAEPAAPAAQRSD